MKQKNIFVFNNYIKNKEIFSLKLSVTRACNLRCKYCFVNKEINHMDIKTAFKAVNFFLSSKGVKKILIVYGGEPLLCPYLKELILYARKRVKKLKKKIVIALPTNGTLLNKNFLLFFKKNNMALSISIDGNKKSHNKNKIFLDKKGSFDVISKNILLAFRIMGQNNISALMTIHPHLSHKLFNNFKTIINLGFRHVHIDPVHGVNWGRKQKSIFLENFRKITTFVIEEIRKNNFIYLNPLFSSLNQKIFKENTENEFCPFYRDLEIYPNGEMAFSQFLLNLTNKKLREKFIIGNIGSNLLDTKYHKCQPDIRNKDCNKCWFAYYKGIRDPKHKGAEIVTKLRENLTEIVNYINKKSLSNCLFKNYLTQSHKRINKFLN